MQSEVKLKNLSWYISQEWPLFPCIPAAKTPLTEHGFKDSTLDPDKIRAWHERWPDCNWAMPTGDKAEGGAGLVVVDVDDADAWDQLRTEHSESIETVTVRTGGGGSQLYFKYPEGHVIKSGTNVLAKGIDIRANGGYVVVPPSETQQRYTFELSPADVAIEELPSWILAKLDGHQPAAIPMPVEERSKEDASRDFVSAQSALNALKPERVENYQSWLECGMALYSLGQDGLVLWDGWSQKSSKYKRGECQQKWDTFTPALQDANKITFGSLIAWAEEDGGKPIIRLAPKNATPNDYLNALAAFGHTFAMNEMNSMIQVDGRYMDDVLENVIKFDLRNYLYKSDRDADVAISMAAHRNQFHPIRDYLTSLHWVGEDLPGVDHIDLLSSYFQDKDGMFPIMLRKWLVGAVGRILGKQPGEPHPVLVLDGKQGLGKSQFARWLGSPLPLYLMQSAVNAADKDYMIRMCSAFVWELEELGATFRKTDLEVLKALLWKWDVTVRLPYGHRDIHKPVTASFIGTVNNSGGFLADPTGNRRYRVCTLTKINWDYQKIIDVNQVWAHAVALFRGGERWQLDADNESRVTEINSSYEVDDPIAFDLYDTYNVDPERPDQFTAMAQIIHRLRADGKVVGPDNQVAQRIANVLTRAGCDKDRVRVSSGKVRVWRGVWLKT